MVASREMRLRFLFALALSALPSFFASAAPEGAGTAPLQLADILAWKRIQVPTVSPDGHWFAYRLSPNDGDSEIVVRHLQTGKEQRFPIGELPRTDATVPPAAGVAAARDLAFSENSQWLAFQVHPTVKEAKALRKQRKPLLTKAVLLQLGTGQKTEYENVKQFRFSGEHSGAIAFHRISANPAPAPATSPAGETPKPDSRPQGSDLLLRDLASGTEMSMGNVSEFAFDKKGDWLAWVVDAQDKVGNGIQLRNMSTGAVYALDSAKANYRSLSWTEKSDGLAALRGTEDKGFEDKLYSVVAFRDFSTSKAPAKVVFDPKTDSSFPSGFTISANRRPSWMEDLSEVTFGIAEAKPKKAPAEGKDDKAKEEDPVVRPDLVLWHWKDDRLQSMQQVQETADRNFSFLSAYRPSDQKFLRLADNTMRQIALAPESKNGVGTDIREYELTSNLDGKRFQDVYTVDLKTGERKLALRKARWYMGANPQATHLVYYNNGSFLSFDVASGKSVNLTEKVPATFINTEDDHNVEKPPTSMVGWSKDGDFVLLSDNWDIWKVPVNGGAGVNLTVNGKKDKIRYRPPFRLDPEAKGIDLSQPLYVSALGEWSKKGGLGIIEPEKPGVHMLHWDDAVYSQVLKAKNADVWLYTRETTQEYPDFFLAGSDLTAGNKVTEANPQQKNFAWTSGSRLVEYTGIRGDKLQGVLYLPANYQAGKTYPTVVYIYEKLSQAANAYPQPGFNGFSVGAYTSNGYAVLTPDITYKVNDPGISAAFCIQAAVKSAIATGVVDSGHMALHGHSWGGYQTAFTVTQTNIFKAAIAGAPLTDMVSMYSSIYWNTGSANQPIFESSQGRFTSGYWDNAEAYLRNSPVYHAKNVQTPLMILHNDKDGAVDHTQGIEYYNTLRRLGKPVIMLEYKGENHGLRKPENMKDYTVRMKEFFDYYLKEKPAPKWLLEGVPLLKMKEST